MAAIEPLQALHYDLERVGGLQRVISPPYDIVDAAGRAALEARSPYNVVRVDLPSGERPYEEAARTLAAWRAQGVVVQDAQPALWALQQSYTGPDGRQRTRSGFLARVRIEDYGPGRIRPHERTHPGPREDRLKLTRATKLNLSPIFALYPDRSNAAWSALAPRADEAPWAQATDDQGTVDTLWRVTDPGRIAAARQALAGAEL